jgi:hypothetical protein
VTRGGRALAGALVGAGVAAIVVAALLGLRWSSGAAMTALFGLEVAHGWVLPALARRPIDTGVFGYLDLVAAIGLPLEWGAAGALVGARSVRLRTAVAGWLALCLVGVAVFRLML